jgi:hypothetical protein
MIHASIRKALLQKCRRARERMKEGASKSARSAVALTAAPRYCCAPTVSRFNLLRQVQRAANSIAVGFQQVSSIFSFGLRKMRMFVKHNARAKPVEVELPQLMQTTIDRAECRNYFRHAGYGVDMIGICSNGVLSA